MQKRKIGKITLIDGARPWKHELETAHALANCGRDVEFIDMAGKNQARTADVRMEGLVWEIKAPVSDKIAMVQKNIRRALHKSPNVIFDVRRMKRLPDEAVEREVRKWADKLKTCKRMLYINRHGTVIEIK